MKPIAIILVVAGCTMAAKPTTGNQPPTISFITPPAGGAMINTGGMTTYDITYDVEDPDADPVTWSLGYSGTSGQAGMFATNLTQGMGTVHADTSALGAGTYQVIATLDDGSSVVTVTGEGALTVPTSYNAAPTVSISEPLVGYYYPVGQALTIGWLATDDGAQVMCDVTASQGGSTITIATGVTATPGAPTTITWTPPAATPLGASYAIDVTVHDDGSPSQTASASSGTFTLGPAPQPVRFSTQIAPLLQSSAANTDGCTKTGCHGSASPPRGLDLTSANAYAKLVNAAAAEAATCTTGGELRVKPGDPNHSYLIAKLQGLGACLSGGRMPKGEAAFPSARTQLFIDWILDGAPNN